ncbi:MAG: ABC transporter ATP-binding protein, partial [Planctomycetales bacterium]|nr:ABC transporter ATP-binding protein [Planctomycetales bacterium]
CGKSTLLRAVLGTHPPCEGKIFVGEKAVTGPNRDVGIVYQHYSLYPFLTARQNVAFGLMLDETSFPYRIFRPFQWRNLKRVHLEKADAMLEKVNLSHALHLYPSEMSGGMCQRVAIAQALIMDPKILLLDEPFGALDEATREHLQLMLLHLYKENLDAKARGDAPPYTIIIVTHELNEAIFVADRVVGLSQYHSDGSKGATIVYDKAAPIYSPSDTKDLAHFVAQKQEILNAVFDESSQRHFSEFVSYWQDIAQAQAAAKV